MTPKKYDLPGFAAGDHFPGLPLVRVREDGVAPTSDLAAVKMRFIPSDRRAVAAVELSTTNGHVTLTSGNDWEAAVPVQAVAGLTAGSWAYNYETTDALGAVRTYMQGKLVVRGELDQEPKHFAVETLLESFTAGDEFPGIPFIRIAINGAAPATDLVSAELRFAQKGKTTVVLSSADDEITLLPMLIRTTAEGLPDALSLMVSGITNPVGANGLLLYAGSSGGIRFWTPSGAMGTPFTAGWKGLGEVIHIESPPWPLPEFVAGNSWSYSWLSSYAASTSLNGMTEPDKATGWEITGMGSGLPVIDRVVNPNQICRLGDTAPYAWYEYDGTQWVLLDAEPAAGWRMAVPAQAVAALTAGKWMAKLRTVDSDGVVRTWCSADQTVLSDC